MKTAKQGLEQGCLVQFRNKEVMMYVGSKKEKGFIDPRNNGHMDLKSYDENLKMKYNDGDGNSNWDIIAYTGPLSLVGMKMDWEKKFQPEHSKLIAWTEGPAINFDKPAIVRQEWTDALGTHYRVLQTNGIHQGIMFEGYIIFDSTDVDLDPLEFSDNWAKPEKGDREDYKLKLIKYLP